MTDLDIEDDPQFASHRSQCPHPAGTEEWKKWQRGFARTQSHDDIEVAAAQARADERIRTLLGGRHLTLEERILGRVPLTRWAPPRKLVDPVDAILDPPEPTGVRLDQGELDIGIIIVDDPIKDRDPVEWKAEIQKWVDLYRTTPPQCNYEVSGAGYSRKSDDGPAAP